MTFLFGGMCGGRVASKHDLSEFSAAPHNMKDII
jgi:hypothetical protein